MADIKQLLTSEMRRLAKREIRQAIQPLQEEIAELRKLVATPRRAKRGTVVESPVQEVAAEEGCDFSAEENATSDVTANTKPLAGITPRRIARLRLKLGLNQSQFAHLLEVAPLSVSRWEAGLTTPRDEQKSRILRVREMGRRELKALMRERNVTPSKERRLRKTRATETLLKTEE